LTRAVDGFRVVSIALFDPIVSGLVFEVRVTGEYFVADGFRSGCSPTRRGWIAKYFGGARDLVALAPRTPTARNGRVRAKGRVDDGTVSQAERNE